MKRQLKAIYVRVSGPILTRLEPIDFLELIADDEFIIIHGENPRKWLSSIPTGHYYFATDGKITYYIRTKEPVKKIYADIEAGKISVQLYAIHGTIAD